MRSNRLLRQRRPGLRVIGPGFYVWDADSREALRLARDLDRHREPAPARQRRTLQRGTLQRQETP